jgi:hypothetical protein
MKFNNDIISNNNTNTKGVQMKVVDGRGVHRKNEKKKNIVTVKQWFQDNPKSTQIECKAGTGLSLSTIRKHLRTLGYL